MKRTIILLLLFLNASAYSKSLAFKDEYLCASGSIDLTSYDPDAQATNEKLIVMVNDIQFYTNNPTLEGILYSAFSNHKDLEIFSTDCEVLQPIRIDYVKFFK